MPGRGRLSASVGSVGVLLGVLLVVVLLVPATPQRLSAQDPAGAWDARWAQAIRVERDGSLEIQAWGDAELVLEVEGDQVTGTWTTSVQETVQWKLSGSLLEGHLLLVATEHDSNNVELAIVERITWDATVSADGIEGHVTLVIRDRPREPAPRPFTAVRAGGR